MKIKKKLSIVIFFMLLIITTYSKTNVNIDLEKLMLLEKKEVLMKLGNRYKIEHVGAEEAYKGYYYKEIGITILFSEDDKNIESIECKDIFKYFETNSGMKFNNINKKLGKVKVEKIYVEPLDTIYYWIKYEYKNYTLIFESKSKNGSNSIMTIYNNKYLPEMYKK